MKYRGLETNTDNNMEDLMSLSNDMAKLEVDQTSSDLIIVTGTFLCFTFIHKCKIGTFRVCVLSHTNWTPPPTGIVINQCHILPSHTNHQHSKSIYTKMNFPISSPCGQLGSWCVRAPLCDSCAHCRGSIVTDTCLGITGWKARLVFLV